MVYTENETKLRELVKAYREYVVLLGKEMEALAGTAYIRGWRSSLFKEGEIFRDKISKLEKDVL
jgi:hypothetical protein